MAWWQGQQSYSEGLVYPSAFPPQSYYIYSMKIEEENRSPEPMEPSTSRRRNSVFRPATRLLSLPNELIPPFVIANDNYSPDIYNEHSPFFTDVDVSIQPPSLSASDTSSLSESLNSMWNPLQTLDHNCRILYSHFTETTRENMRVWQDIYNDLEIEERSQRAVTSPWLRACLLTAPLVKDETKDMLNVIKRAARLLHSEAVVHMPEITTGLLIKFVDCKFPEAALFAAHIGDLSTIRGLQDQPYWPDALEFLERSPLDIIDSSYSNGGVVRYLLESDPPIMTYAGMRRLIASMIRTDLISDEVFRVFLEAEIPIRFADQMAEAVFRERSMRSVERLRPVRDLNSTLNRYFGAIENVVQHSNGGDIASLDWRQLPANELQILSTRLLLEFQYSISGDAMVTDALIDEIYNMRSGDLINWIAVKNPMLVRALVYPRLLDELRGVEPVDVDFVRGFLKGLMEIPPVELLDAIYFGENESHANMILEEFGILPDDNQVTMFFSQNYLRILLWFFEKRPDYTVQGHQVMHFARNPGSLGLRLLQRIKPMTLKTFAQNILDEVTTSGSPDKLLWCLSQPEFGSIKPSLAAFIDLARSPFDEISGKLEILLSAGAIPMTSEFADALVREGPQSFAFLRWYFENNGSLPSGAVVRSLDLVDQISVLVPERNRTLYQTLMLASNEGEDSEDPMPYDIPLEQLIRHCHPPAGVADGGATLSTTLLATDERQSVKAITEENPVLFGFIGLSTIIIVAFLTIICIKWIIKRQKRKNPNKTLPPSNTPLPMWSPSPDVLAPRVFSPTPIVIGRPISVFPAQSPLSRSSIDDD